MLSVLDDVLANATNLITLRINNVTSLDLGVVANYANSANFSFTASVSNYAPVPSLSTVSLLCIFQRYSAYCMYMP